MVVFQVVQAANITSCNGVVHLRAGRHTLFAEKDCGNCQIVGEPGAVLDGPVNCGGRNATIAPLFLNGSLVIQGHGESKCVAVGSGLVIHGDISIKDCDIGNGGLGGLGWSVEIVGPSSGESLVTFTNSSIGRDPEGMSLYPALTISNHARVKFSDFVFESYDGDRGNLIQILESSVVLERGNLFLEDTSYHFQNSTIIATNTTFACGHGQTGFAATNSVLNFTNSTVSMMGYSGGRIDITNCSLDATCGATSGDVAYPVFFTGGGEMGIYDSIVRFAHCSCHLDQAISLGLPSGQVPMGHTLSFQKSSVSFSACSTYGVSSKVDPAVVV